MMRNYSSKHHNMLIYWIEEVVTSSNFYNTDVLSHGDIKILRPIIVDYTDELVSKLLALRRTSTNIIQLVGCGALIVVLQHVLGYDWGGVPYVSDHMAYMTDHVYTPKDVEDMAICIHKMCDFFPHVELKNPDHREFIDNMFVINIKEERNRVERDYMHSQCMALTKDVFARHRYRILMANRKKRHHRSQCFKRRRHLLRRKSRSVRNFFKKLCKR